MQGTVQRDGNPDGLRLRLGDEILPWSDILRQLQVFGRLRPFLQEVVCQKIILDEIRSRVDLELNPVDLDAEITQFRARRRLVDDSSFKDWLLAEQLDYQSFRARVYLGCKLKLLKARIADPDLSAEFECQSNSLEQIELSYLACRSEADANRFAGQLQVTDQSGFEMLASQEAANPDVAVQASATPLARVLLPEYLRSALGAAAVGELVGPIQMGDRWILARINSIIPAVLDEKNRNRLTNQLFKRWLQDRLSEKLVSLVD